MGAASSRSPSSDRAELVTSSGCTDRAGRTAADGTRCPSTSSTRVGERAGRTRRGCSGRSIDARDHAPERPTRQDLPTWRGRRTAGARRLGCCSRDRADRGPSIRPVPEEFLPRHPAGARPPAIRTADRGRSGQVRSAIWALALRRPARRHRRHGNRNLLVRINRELDGDFAIECAARIAPPGRFADRFARREHAPRLRKRRSRSTSERAAPSTSARSAMSRFGPRVRSKYQPSGVADPTPALRVRAAGAMDRQGGGSVRADAPSRPSE